MSILSWSSNSRFLDRNLLLDKPNLTRLMCVVHFYEYWHKLVAVAPVPDNGNIFYKDRLALMGAMGWNWFTWSHRFHPSWRFCKEKEESQTKTDHTQNISQISNHPIHLLALHCVHNLCNIRQNEQNWTKSATKTTRTKHYCRRLFQK